MTKHVFDELKSLATESVNPFTSQIDQSSSLEIVRAINREDQRCAQLVSEQAKDVANAIDLTSKKLSEGGRLIYIGAGTSGRLGVLDASECPPTFGTDPELVQALIAGGKEALFTAQEGSEDQYDQAWKDLEKINLSKKDVLCGIMASGRTPYVVGAIETAKKHQIATILIACNKAEYVKVKADVNICVDTAAEVIMGSTRMKAGTVQKMLLNMISTGSMIRLGKVYGNIMVDLQMNSKKLEERAKKIVMMICELHYEEAEKLLLAAKGHVKSAIVMQLCNLDYEKAQKQLKAHKGFIQGVLNEEKVK